MGLFSGRKKEMPERARYADSMNGMPGGTDAGAGRADEDGQPAEAPPKDLKETPDMTKVPVINNTEETSQPAAGREPEQTKWQEMEAASAGKEERSTMQSQTASEDGKGELLNEVLDYFIANEGKLLARMQSSSSEKSRKEVMKKAEEQFRTRNLSKKDTEEMMDRFSRYMWGYYILDPLIEDRTVFDIKCYSDTHIRIKRMGERMDAPAEIRFSSPADYVRFVRMAATKNQVNLSVINALTTFTDKESNPDFILRFNISTEYINSSGMPCLHIRKLAKNKYSMSELVGLGFMTEEERAYFEDRAANSGGILFTGSGGSGKTTFMNSLLEVYPHDRSALVIQENEELFTRSHPDMNFQHVVTSNGEGKVSYTLEDLARQGLLDDIDLFVIGEIKGKEAGSFAMCSYTGAQAWCSCHGKNEKEAIFKLADYVKMATGYSLRESLKVLSGIEVIVYIKNFHIEGVSEIRGWDYEKETLIIEKKTFGSKEVKACEGKREGQKVQGEPLLESMSEFIF